MTGVGEFSNGLLAVALLVLGPPVRVDPIRFFTVPLVRLGLKSEIGLRDVVAPPKPPAKHLRLHLPERGTDREDLARAELGLDVPKERMAPNLKPRSFRPLLGDAVQILAGEAQVLGAIVLVVFFVDHFAPSFTAMTSTILP